MNARMFTKVEILITDMTWNHSGYEVRAKDRITIDSISCLLFSILVKSSARIFF